MIGYSVTAKDNKLVHAWQEYYSSFRHEVAANLLGILKN